MEIEKQLSISRTEASTYKSKYEAEFAAHQLEVEDLKYVSVSRSFFKNGPRCSYRKKFSIRLSEAEEQVQNALARASNLEKQKSRLQAELEIIIIDLEKVRTKTSAGLNKISYQKLFRPIQRFSSLKSAMPLWKIWWTTSNAVWRKSVWSWKLRSVTSVLPKAKSLDWSKP